MSEITTIEQDRINPIRIHDNITGKVYELDFSRESVKFAEGRGFTFEDVTKFPATKLPEFFYLAFRKNHKNVARSQTDALIESMGGLSATMIERLGQLYTQAGYTHVIATDEDAEKNGNVTVEM